LLLEVLEEIQRLVGLGKVTSVGNCRIDVKVEAKLMRDRE